MTRFSGVAFHFLVVLFLVSAGSCSPGTVSSGLNPGDAAPEIQGYDLKGKLVSLSDYRGKVVVLNFWASWCTPCIEELPALERLRQLGNSKGIEVISVAVDRNTAAVDEVAREARLQYPAILDKDMQISQRYKVSGFPETFIISPEGKLVLFPDPETGQAIVRLTGPRRWDSPQMLKRIFEFGKQAPQTVLAH